MSEETALSILLSKKDSFVSRYSKRRHWWFTVELPLTPNSVYDDIPPSPISPGETNLTNKFLDSLSVATPHHLIRAYNADNYIFGYIHYPSKNVSKWKAAYDLKIFPRCIVAEAPTAILKATLRPKPLAVSKSTMNSMESNLTSITYETLHDSLGYNTTFSPQTWTLLNTPNITTLKNQIKNSSVVIIPTKPKRRQQSHNPNRARKWEIYLNTK